MAHAIPVSQEISDANNSVASYRKMSSRGREKKGGKSLGANRMKISKYVLVYKMSQLPLFFFISPFFQYVANRKHG